MTKKLAKIKMILCKNCGLKGHCAEDVKCNDIEEIEKIFRFKGD